MGFAFVDPEKLRKLADQIRELSEDAHKLTSQALTTFKLTKEHWKDDEAEKFERDHLNLIVGHLEDAAKLAKEVLPLLEAKIDALHRYQGRR